ncbi:MAG: hydantoinase B/oxoprolinase family protein [Ardenticatenaceae bacterium]|nr:hydantoinase B/oxoprolinase family protein [Ardenticatenaceae bacterium]
MTLSEIDLSILNHRLEAIVENQAAVLKQSSFSSILSDAGDFSCALFDEAAQMLAQSVTGTPGHSHSMALGVRGFLSKYPPSTLSPGDVLISNDAWMLSGHSLDITVVVPVFHQGRVVAYAATTAHAADIGGRMFSAEGTEIYEEGLQLPVLKLFDRNRLNDDLIQIIRMNVRVPDQVIGDILAQASAGRATAAKVVELLNDYRIDSLGTIATDLIERAECAMRSAISELPDGRYSYAIELDGLDEPLLIQCTVTIDGERMIIDYSGTSGQTTRGINSVYNFTAAYAHYGVQCVLAMGGFANEGAFRPLEIIIPEGSLLNAIYPAPVNARHLTVHFAVFALHGALHKAAPERVPAESAGPIGAFQFDGRSKEGKRWTYIFFASGGMGARPSKDGLATTFFPNNALNIPVEVVESDSPVLMECKELISDSGGPGRYRGGLGQRLVMRVRGDSQSYLSCMLERLSHPATGLQGGGTGSTTRIFTSRRPTLDPKSRIEILPDEVITVELPGGGGFGLPTHRDRHVVLADIREGYITAQEAYERFALQRSD